MNTGALDQIDSYCSYCSLELERFKLLDPSGKHQQKGTKLIGLRKNCSLLPFRFWLLI